MPPFSLLVSTLNIIKFKVLVTDQYEIPTKALVRSGKWIMLVLSKQGCARAQRALSAAQFYYLDRCQSVPKLCTMYFDLHPFLDAFYLIILQMNFGSFH